MKISVVTPTYQRRVSLRNLIRSLEEQSFKDFELVVISNSESQADLEFVKSLCAETELEVQVVSPEKNLGPGGGRNFGVSQTKGEFLAFIDDDCLADKEWLQVINDSLNSNNKIIFGPVSSAVSPSPPFIHGFDMQGGSVFGAGNFAIEKKYFIEIGLFDTFLNNWSEDYELYKRSINSGYTPVFNEGMKVDHPPKIVTYNWKTHLISKEFMQKYFYLTDHLQIEYKVPLIKNMLKISLKKLGITIFLIILGTLLGLSWSSMILPFMFFIGFQMRKLPRLSKLLISYPYNERFSWSNYFVYLYMAWIIDILNGPIAYWYSLSFNKKQLLEDIESV